MMHYFYDGMMGFGGGLFMIIFWIALAALIVWVIAGAGRRRYFDDYGREQPRRNSGLDILNERYAKGEISKEEYEQKRKDILA